MNDGALSFEFIGPDPPFQAVGHIGDRPFHFYARYQRWEFTVGSPDGPDPFDMGVVVPESLIEYEQEGRYGDGPYDAGYMPDEVAERIIRDCAAAYLRRRGAV